MYCSGDTIENPVTGERITFLRAASATDGELVVVETTVKPGGFVAATHVHPFQEERFHVVRGTLAMKADGETFELGESEHVVVSAGTAHTFWNAGDDDVTFVCEVRPALGFEPLLGTMFALAADGKTNRRGMPNLLRLAVVASAYFDTVRLPFPPAIVQRIGLALLAPLGRLFGYRATYAPASRAAWKGDLRESIS